MKAINIFLERVISYFERKPLHFGIILLILLAPALLINLGLLPLTTDEPIRALVGLEMVISDDYITPSMFGEYYLKKPPLYIWLLVGSANIFGGFTEWAMRLPTVLWLILYCMTIFYFSSKFMNRRFAIINALIFLTCGRILFWDSQLGLIDICLSWLIYTMFMLIFHFFNRSDYRALFLTAYGLAAIGFLMKGLPSIVFLGLSLLAIFTYKKKFLKLFNYWHFIGIALFLLIVGAYYYAYFKRFPGSASDLFSVLWSETTDRTVVKFGWQETFRHLFSFPMEMSYHFAPWTLMLILLLRKKLRKIAFSNPFIKYNLIIFLVNIPIYWTSPQVYPRYLLMLAPLIFTVYLFFYDEFDGKKDWRIILFNILGGILLFGSALGVFSVPFVKESMYFTHVWPKVIGLFILLLFLSLLYVKKSRYRLIFLALGLIIIRIGFNWFVIPARKNLAYNNIVKEYALDIARKTKGQPLYILSGTPVDTFTAFYVTRDRNQILTRVNDVYESGYYISEEAFLQGREYEFVMDFTIEWEKRQLKLVKIEKE